MFGKCYDKPVDVLTGISPNLHDLMINFILFILFSYIAKHLQYSLL